MACKVHKPNPWAWQCEETFPENEHEYGYSVLTTTCCDCRKLLIVQVANVAMSDETHGQDLPILGIPEEE